MKYMIMVFGDRSTLVDRSQEWVDRLIRFMHQIDRDLESAGELVFQQGLADPSEARTVAPSTTRMTATAGSVIAPVDALAGFWIVDVADEARAVEIAASIAAVTEAPVEVRACMEAPPERG
jgi:hypothetical protein